MLRNGTSVPPAPAPGAVEHECEDGFVYYLPKADHADFVRYSRYRAFVMGCGIAAFDLEKKFAGAKERRKMGRALVG